MTNIAASARLNWRAIGWSTAAAVALLPGVAMTFTREMNWGPGDFLAFAALLLALGLAVELAVRIARRTLHRAMAIIGAAGLFLLLWAELAVGVF